MLSRAHYGWTEFSVGKNKYSLSYLTNIPIEWLDQAIHGLKTLLPFTVHGFCEPGRMLCTVSYWNCHIIFENENNVLLSEEETETEIANVSMLEFCKMLYNDISENIDAWSEWCTCYDCENKKQEQRVFRAFRREILKRLNLLKKLIEKNEVSFREGRCFF